MVLGWCTVEKRHFFVWIIMSHTQKMSVNDPLLVLVLQNQRGRASDEQMTD